jgi:hypothetical protein
MVAGVVVLAGCIGATDRSDFEETIGERGSGLTEELPRQALDAVAAELGVDVEELAVRSMTVTGTSDSVSLEVRDPGTPENLDQYVVGGGSIDSVEPVLLSAEEDLDLTTFPVTGLAFDRIENMVDEALARFDQLGAVATTLTVTLVSQGAGEGKSEPVAGFGLSLESPRATGTASFTAAGELVEVVRT